MAATLKAGYSVENAIRETYEDLKVLYKKDSRILKEYEQMIYKLNINRTAEQVLEEFSENVKQEDVRNFITVFPRQKEAEAIVYPLYSIPIKLISEKIETEKEIQTLLASKKIKYKSCVLSHFVSYAI